MAIVKFGDIVRDVKINVDRANNPYEHYVAGDHMDSEDLTIHRYGNFETDDVGPAFTRIFKPGQILYGSRRTYLKKVAVADFEGICANTTFVLESKDYSLFDNRLLPFIMLSDAFTRWSIAHSKGSTNPYVLFSDLADYEFDLPPIAEQKVLADKLWAAYRLKESYKKLLTATEEMVKSQFIEMAGDLPKNGTLSDYCEMKAGKSIKSDSINSQYNDGLYPCYGGNGLRGYVETYSHDGVYNIIGRQGALCGNITLTKGKFYATEHAIVVRPKTPINEYWLYFALAQMNLNQYARGVAQPGLAVKQLEKLPFGIPSKGKQEKFAAVYQQADKSKFELRKSIVSIDKVIKSLINENI